jgi:hypothetical protein
MKKTICFDIDGVICKSKTNDYKKSIPIKKNIKTINLFYEADFEIKLYTARFMGRSGDNKKIAEKSIKKITLIQLKKWGVKYHKIIFGKPSYDYLVDDKCVFFKKNWKNELKKKINFFDD